MRLTFGFLVLCLVAGCAFSPPKPKQCEGEFRPVNQTTEKGAALTREQNLAMCTKGGINGNQG
jgi:hypothetical protein